jgi:hypothetical protein
MRELADAERIRRFMRELGDAADADGACYLAGGATAVLLGWRATTIDVDIRLVPESDLLLRAIPRLKDALGINVELAAPPDFIPVPMGWEDRSPFAGRFGRLSYYHFDPYSQALAKVERAHVQDLADVRAMIQRELVEPAQARAYFDEIEPQLYRFPAVDARAFRRRVEDALGG